MDDPRVLPSLHKHLWGRAASLGSLILKAEKDVRLKDPKQGVKELYFGCDPLRISGEGCGLMLEWSKPTVVTVIKALAHLKQEYQLLGGAHGLTGSCLAETGAVLGAEEEKKQEISKDGQDDSNVVGGETGFQVEVKVQFTAVNAFVYGLTPGVCLSKDPPHCIYPWVLGNSCTCTCIYRCRCSIARHACIVVYCACKHILYMYIFSHVLSVDSMHIVCIHYTCQSYIDCKSTRLLSAEPPAAMLRLDAASLTASSSSFKLELHDLLVENLGSFAPDHPFLCSSIADLPEGVGMVTVSSLGVNYQQQIKVSTFVNAHNKL